MNTEHDQEFDLSDEIALLIKQSLAVKGYSLGQTLAHISYALMALAARANVPKEALLERLGKDMELVYRAQALKDAMDTMLDRGVMQ